MIKMIGNQRVPFNGESTEVDVIVWRGQKVEGLPHFRLIGGLEKYFG